MQGGTDLGGEVMLHGLWCRRPPAQLPCWALLPLMLLLLLLLFLPLQLLLLVVLLLRAAERAHHAAAHITLGDEDGGAQGVTHLL